MKRIIGKIFIMIFLWLMLGWYSYYVATEVNKGLGYMLAGVGGVLLIVFGFIVTISHRK